MAVGNRPRILLVNDDGIHAPGLRALYRSLCDFAELVVVAPTEEASGSGMGVTFDRHLEVQPVDWGEGAAAWSVSGTPADCVRVALYSLLDERPDFIFSGINWGSNAGRNVLYSGTVAAALEASLLGVPGVALSQSYEGWEAPVDFSTAEQWLPTLVEYVVQSELPCSIALNVNFPSCKPSEVAGFRMARQGRGYWGVRHSEPELHAKGHRIFAGGSHLQFEEPFDSDVSLLKQGYLVAVPLMLPEWTAHEIRESHGRQFEEHFDRQ